MTIQRLKWELRQIARMIRKEWYIFAFMLAIAIFYVWLI